MELGSPLLYWHRVPRDELAEDLLLILRVLVQGLQVNDPQASWSTPPRGCRRRLPRGSCLCLFVKLKVQLRSEVEIWLQPRFIGIHTGQQIQALNGQSSFLRVSLSKVIWRASLNAYGMGAKKQEGLWAERSI